MHHRIGNGRADRASGHLACTQAGLCGVIDELLFVLQYEESAPVAAECVLALETVGLQWLLRFVQFGGKG